MATSYPGGIDAFTNPTATDSLASATVPHATQHANANDAIEAIETELGTNPKGASASVKARLDTLDTTVAGKAATVHTHAQSDVTNLTTDLAAKAPTANPTLTGVVTHDAGSASAPSITYSGDTNTGIYSPGADQVGIATAGTARVNIDNATNGYITIAAATTDIKSDSTTALFIRQASTDTDGADNNFDKYRGTLASPTVVASGDQLGTMWFRGYDGSALRNAAAIRASVDGSPGASDMPGRLEFYTTLDGSASLTERMRIDNAGLITGTGTSLGAWTSYTPTLGGTGWAIGDGTATGAYCQIGKTVIFRARIVFGATSTAGASASATVTMPINARTGFGGFHVVAVLKDASTGSLYPAITDPGTGLFTIYATDTSGSTAVMTPTTNTVPFSWTTSDEIRVFGTYEIA